MIEFEAEGCGSHSCPHTPEFTPKPDLIRMETWQELFLSAQRLLREDDVSNAFATLKVLLGRASPPPDGAQELYSELCTLIGKS